MTDVRSGLPDVRLRPGDHVCAFHFGETERDKILLAYVKAGLRASDRCICLVEPEATDAMRASIGGDGEPGAASGPVVVADPAQSGPGSASFSLERIVAILRDAADSGVQDDSSGITRLAVDLTWLHQTQPPAWDPIEFDTGLGRSVARYPQAVLCLCDLERFDVSEAMELLATHPKVIFGGRLVDSPYYRPGGADHPRSADRGPWLTPRAEAPQRRTEERGVLRSAQALLGLSALMTATGDVRRIMQLAAKMVSSFGRSRLDGVFLEETGWRLATGSCADAKVRAVLEALFAQLGSAGGALPTADHGWSWALPLGDLKGSFGYLVVAGDAEPPAEERFLLRLLSQQVGNALAHARLDARLEATATALARATTDLSEFRELAEWRDTVHERLDPAVLAGERPVAIARVVHDLTGYPVAVEGPHGDVWAWAGPGRPQRYPTDPPAHRRRLVHHARAERRPVRAGDRILALAHRRDDLLGALVLFDPDSSAGERESMALAQGARVLAMELGHQRELALTEARLGRELARDLVDGTADESAISRAHLLGYDLARPHRVVVVERQPDSDFDPQPDAAAEPFFHAVRRAARDTGMGSLLTTWDSRVVVVADAEGRWEDLRPAILSEPGGGPCRVGIGEPCADPAGLPQSYRQALLAVEVQDVVGAGDRTVAFDRLGIFRLLAEIAGSGAADRFAREWLRPLAPLLDYDQRTGSDLVTTLSHYLELGGRYDATARALGVHRSTLKYRLQRIKDVAGSDLSDPATQFDLQLATRAWRTLTVLRGS